jgi:Xaa-Pro dipeptidase
MSDTSRLERLRRLIRQEKLDAVAFVPGPNLAYLTGVYWGLSERPLIAFFPAEGDPALALPILEMPKIESKAPFPLRFFTYTDTEGYEPALHSACQALGLSGKRIGVEGLKMRVLEGQVIQKDAPGSIVESADEALMALRIHKDPQEIAAMRRAIAVSEKALEATLAQVRPGMTERQIANILAIATADAGGGDNAFDPIVLSGPNSGQPHGTISDRPVSDGELLLFDFGTKLDGYPADITRTFVVGQPGAELVKLYDMVLRANEAGIKAIKPGVTAQDVDRATRQVIVSAGYGEYFIHRTGHGLGLDIHEAPNIREGNTQVLEPGMVFTVEPGVYLPELGGIRVEDDVLVTESGVDVLTAFPKKTLRSVGH